MSFTAPTIQAGAIAGTVGKPYDYAYTIFPGSYGPPYTISVSAGALPAGINLNTATGELMGTPAAPGTFPYTLTIYSNANPGLTSSTPDSITISSPPPDCKELGRVTRSFVSGYTASRLESRRIRRFSKRCCVADFNGAMPLGVTITHVRWDCTSPWSIFMANPRVESSGRKVAIDASFNFAGWGGLLATATWSNGEVTNVEFSFQTIDRPLYPSAVYPSSTGPYVLEADA